MEKAQKQKAIRRLNSLIGGCLTMIYRGADMPAMNFKSTKGTPIAIHCFSRMMILNGVDIVIDSDDIYNPVEGVEPRKNYRYEIGECVYDVNANAFANVLPLRVVSAEVKDDGSIRIKLEQGFRCAVVPWPNNPDEAWRIFRPHHRQKHLVYYGSGELKLE